MTLIHDHGFFKISSLVIHIHGIEIRYLILINIGQIRDIKCCNDNVIKYKNDTLNFMSNRFPQLNHLQPNLTDFQNRHT